MLDDEFLDENEPTDYDLYTGRIAYGFDPNQYAVNPGNAEISAEEQQLAAEIKRFFPELANWGAGELVKAWRSYSQDVCLIDEEFVCVRTPDFLAYLYVVQEGWNLADRTWLNAVQEAVNILWPHAAEMKGRE